MSNGSHLDLEAVYQIALRVLYTDVGTSRAAEIAESGMTVTKTAGQDYRFVAIASAVTHARPAHLQWGCPGRYKVNPDERPFAAADRASLAIPLLLPPCPEVRPEHRQESLVGRWRHAVRLSSQCRRRSGLGRTTVADAQHHVVRPSARSSAERCSWSRHAVQGNAHMSGSTTGSTLTVPPSSLCGSRQHSSWSPPQAFISRRQRQGRPTSR
jgi:hypothetical protein